MYRISVDVGGTFTDVVVGANGKLTLGKALTTPERSFTGFFNALRNAAEALDTSAEAILRGGDILVYGTTRATNAIVEGKTAKTALLVTAGFPDVLLYRQGGRERPFFLHFDYPQTYIPRKYTFEIPERITAEGQVERPLDEAAVRRVLEELRSIRIEAIAVCLLWSVVNGRHEKRVGELVREVLPDVPYTLSSELNAIVREYPRASSASIDVSLKPLMQRHLRELSEDLSAHEFAGELLISASSGGVVHAEDAIDRPIFMTKSGPAMAPLAGLAFAASEGLGADLIVVDTGGTTFDVSLVRNGHLKYSRDTWLLGKWIGHTLGVSTVDVSSIGAGGGSIAWVDSGGLLRVGPESAGANPGPACYARGGDRATVTDAAVVLGYIDPKSFLGGRMSLDVAAATRVVEVLARQLALRTEVAAAGVLRIANEHMIKAIEEITVNDGVNPRESTIVAGGGAAGLNIVPIARALGCRRVLVPNMAGGLSACGAQYSDVVVEHSASAFASTARFDFEAVNAAIEGLETWILRFARRFASKGLTKTEQSLFVEARYVGQHYEIEIPVPVQRFHGQEDLAALIKTFHDTHERQYSVRDEGAALECLNWKMRLRATLPKPSTPREIISTVATPSAERFSMAYFGEEGFIKAGVFSGPRLAAGTELDGPAIIEEPTTTIVVYPGSRATVTGGRNYLLETQVS